MLRFLLLFLFSLSSFAQDLCQQFEKNPMDSKLNVFTIYKNHSDIRKLAIGTSDFKKGEIQFSAVSKFCLDDKKYGYFDLLSYSKNNFDEDEVDISFFDFENIYDYEATKKIGYNASINSQEKQNLDFSSSNIQLGPSYTYTISNRLFFTLGPNIILDSDFSDVYPRLVIFLNHEPQPHQLSLKLSKKYRKDYLNFTIKRLVKDYFNMEAVYENIKDADSRLFLRGNFIF